MRFPSHSPEETEAIGARLAAGTVPGDIFLLRGPLGAGKTTLVRGFLRACGYDGPVRSPTFNLIQTFDLDPPVLHADLYRLGGAEGIGLEDYLETHVCLIEWPERAEGFFGSSVTNVTLFTDGETRQIEIKDS